MSESLKQIVMMMLNKDPIRRPTTEQLLLHPEIAQRIQQFRRDINNEGNDQYIAIFIRCRKYAIFFIIINLLEY
ncbi:MAG: hypothetical protein EZS28_039801 [Streblomastix strix]|uniref:Protein kinase domain-containing protein n=1 Tax=Streblomastix strix TaxID=222440 RepID=A0A5J4U406_9EUKA|nr:MAG: hypothetical protein EZS28_039801 [Streblomastix strix]